MIDLREVRYKLRDLKELGLAVYDMIALDVGCTIKDLKERGFAQVPWEKRADALLRDHEGESLEPGELD